MARSERSERIRHGGKRTDDGYLYELTGGVLCLDFANTVDSRPTEDPRELLLEYGDLVDWAEQAGGVSSRGAKALRARAEGRPRQARAALLRARGLREALFGIFSAIAGGEPAPAAALDTLNVHLPESLARLRVARVDPVYAWEWEADASFESVLWPVTRSAAELLTSDRLDRVRECAADVCAWLFLDQSRNRSRRWCDMTVCGNRSKVRRFRQAQRGG